MRAFQRLLSYVVCPGDTPEIVNQKQLLLALLVPSCAAAMYVGWALNRHGFDPFDFYNVGGMWITATVLSGIAYLVAFKFVSRRMLEMLCLTASVGILLADWSAASLPGAVRLWPTLVIVTDMLLLINATRTATNVLMAGVVIWVAITCVEDGVRFGMYDVVVHPQRSRTKYISCESPPCAYPEAAVMKFVVTLLVYVTDYVITRRFARLMRVEQERLENAVAISQRIAALLAEFDLDKAEQLIFENPSAMSDVLGTLMNNLRTYRPYLPDSCFPQCRMTSDEDVMSVEVCDLDPTVSCSADSAPMHRELAVAEAPCERNVTLLVVNIKSFLTFAKDAADPSGVMSDVLDAYLNDLVREVQDTRGVMDGFSGDRVMVCYNGAKRCLRHSSNAVRCGVALSKSSRFSIAAGCGRAVCGDLGCSSMKRYTCLGSVVSRVHLLERLHKTWDVMGVLCDQAVHEASCDFIFQLLPLKVAFTKDTDPTAHNIWIALREFEAEPEEWMYELERARGESNGVLKAVQDYRDGATTSLVEILPDDTPNLLLFSDLMNRPPRVLKVSDVGLEEAA
eukprot:Sspe_Gene.77925::Locus_48723_Transcript_2_3_Confidence_0.500_Length_1786::g.77925::m.77925